MSERILKHKDWVVHGWDGGRTAEIFLYPAGASWQKKDFHIRLSTAICNGADSVFTDFTGFTRWISPKKGRLAMVHILEDGSKKTADLAPFEIDQFEGVWKTTSTGAYEDFNLLTSEDFTGAMSAVQSGSNATFDAEKDFLAGFFCTAPSVLVRLEGKEKSQAHILQETDFLLLEAEDRESFRLYFEWPGSGPIGFWVTVRKK